MPHTITKECRLYVCRRHRASFCVEHDAWLGTTCEGPCIACSGRSEKPSGRAEAMITNPSAYGDRAYESPNRSEDSESSSE